MPISLSQARMNVNPVLTNMMLGMGQGNFIAERILPPLPQALRGMTLIEAGNAHRRHYNLKRAPGALTRRIDVRLGSQVYTVEQYSVEIGIPRELLQEAATANRLNIGTNLDISRIAVSTAREVLALDYEIETAEALQDPGIYSSRTVALTGTAQWSHASSKPVDDINEAREAVRKATGVRPNTLYLSADTAVALYNNAQVRSYLPSTQLGQATDEQLRTIFKVNEIIIGDGVHVKPDNSINDIWQQTALLFFKGHSSGGQDMSLATPTFGFTSTLEGHPFVETPYEEKNLKSWIYGATHERKPNIATPESGFLFTTTVAAS